MTRNAAIALVVLLTTIAGAFTIPQVQEVTHGHYEEVITRSKHTDIIYFRGSMRKYIPSALDSMAINGLLSPLVPDGIPGVLEVRIGATADLPKK